MLNKIQWDLHSFFFQKLTKIAQRLRALPPDQHGHRRDTFEYTSLLNMSPKLDLSRGSAPRPPSVIRLITPAYSHTSPKLDVCTF